MKPTLGPWKWDAGLAAYAIACETTADFLRAADWKRGENATTNSETGDPKTRLTATYREAVDLMANGWPEGAADARKLSARLMSGLSETLSTERHAAHWNVAGDEPDIDRVLTGEPENMLEFRPEPVPSFGRVAALIVDGSVSIGVTAASLVRIAVLLGALVDALEANGVRVEVEIRYRSEDVAKVGGRKIDTELSHVLKRAEQPLDLARVVAGFHPSAFRRVAFRWFECLGNTGSGYGHTAKSRRPLPVGGVALSLPELTGLTTEAEQLEWITKKTAEMTT